MLLEYEVGFAFNELELGEKKRLLGREVIITFPGEDQLKEFNLSSVGELSAKCHLNNQTQHFQLTLNSYAENISVHTDLTDDNQTKIALSLSRDPDRVRKIRDDLSAIQEELKLSEDYVNQPENNKFLDMIDKYLSLKESMEDLSNTIKNMEKRPVTHDAQLSIKNISDKLIGLKAELEALQQSFSASPDSILINYTGTSLTKFYNKSADSIKDMIDEVKNNLERISTPKIAENLSKLSEKFIGMIGDM